MRQPLFIYISIAILIWHPIALTDTTADSLEGMMSEWLALERQSEQIRSDWQQQKLILSQRTDLLRIEELELQKQIQENSGLANKGQTLRRSLAEQQTQLEQRQVLLTAGLDRIEKQIYSIIPRLPDPLSQIWQRTLRRLNSPSEQTLASRRLESYLSLFKTLERFESKVTHHHALMNLDGETFLADQFYLGLGTAWYLSADGSFAGYGHGHGSSWEWQADVNLAPQLVKLKQQFNHPEGAELVEVKLRLSSK